MGLSTDWLKIGQSGNTTDGRMIDPQWLRDAAETYNPKTYTALIWPDHMRYTNYGKVLELRVEEQDGVVSLYAKLEPNAFYQSDVRFAQMLFTSMEITPNFAKTGKAYLTGLGATDEPASLGTTEVRFSKNAETAGVQLGETVEATPHTFNDPAPSSLMDQLRQFFKKEESDMDKAALDAINAQLAQFKQQLEALKPATATEQPDPGAQFKALSDKVDALAQKLESFTKTDGETDKVAELTAQFNALQATVAEALKEQPGTQGAGQAFSAEGINPREYA